MLLFKGFFVSLPLDKGLVSSNNFYYCRYFSYTVTPSEG